MQASTARKIQCGALITALLPIVYSLAVPWQVGNHFLYLWDRGGSDGFAHYGAALVVALGSFSAIVMLLGWRRRVIPRQASAVAVLMAAIAMTGTIVAIHRMSTDTGTDPERMMGLRAMRFFGDPTVHATAAPWFCLGGLALALVASFAIWRTPESEVDELT